MFVMLFGRLDFHLDKLKVEVTPPDGQVAFKYQILTLARLTLCDGFISEYC